MPNNSSKLSSAGSYYVNVKKYIAHFVPNVSRISSLAKLLTYFICNWFWLFHNNKILDHTDLQVVSIELVQLSHLRIFLCENMKWSYYYIYFVTKIVSHTKNEKKHKKVKKCFFPFISAFLALYIFCNKVLMLFYLQIEIHLKNLICSSIWTWISKLSRNSS